MKTLAILLSALAAVGSRQAPPLLSPALATLVETERAFARMSVAQGRREAFLAFFGDDALFFTPAPVNARQVIHTWPAPGPFKLDWEPRFGDVAQAGDLGYTTGPFVRTSPGAEAKVLATGWYFTVWKKQPDDTWKVAIDTGVEAPPAGALRPARFQPAEAERVKADQSPGPLLAVDRSLCALMASGGIAGAFEAAGTGTTRIYREEIAPITGAAALRSYFASQPGRTTCDPARDEVSRSADLGYTYGTYTIERSPKEAGCYLRVWRRQGRTWKVAVDVTIPGQ